MNPAGERCLSIVVSAACAALSIRVAWHRRMTLQEQSDDAMFDFSQGDFDRAIVKFKAVLAADPKNFDAQLALGMAFYRKDDFAAAIAEGHKAEQLRPKEQLVHTNLSLFYMKSGDKVTAEKHGLQAKIESWRADAARAKSPETISESNPELVIAKPTSLPMKFPSQPWKKKKVDS
jgi:Flp pilus assembly protein TadD